MSFRFFKIFVPVLAIFFLLILHSPAFSQESSSVTVNNQKIFDIKTPVGSFTPKARAQAISQRIINLAKDQTFDVNSIQISDKKNYTNITANGSVIMTITNSDAQAANKSKTALAYDYRQRIQRAIREYRNEHSLRHILLGIFYTIAATLFLIIVFKLFRFLYKWLIKKLRSFSKYIKPLKIQRFELLPVSNIFKVIIGFIKFLGITGEIGLVYFYLVFVLGLFSWTQGFAEDLSEYFISSLRNIGTAIVAYIPSLFFIILVIVLTRYILKLVKYIFKGIEEGRIVLSGFYKEWSEPTSKIVQFLVLALVLAIIFPYLPGADTAAFKGISVFVGALVTFGSSSAIANIIAGIILTYTRAFKIEDRVKIADTIGDIVEKNLLVTRIRTIKYEIISIPNSVVLQSHIINYSSSAKDPGLILHTRVTIGYNTLWSKVYNLLISAALSTDNILHKPDPFVLQAGLNDFFVTYELNAYTDKPEIMQNIYSELHKNIQDKFNEAGVEIMSPHYTAIRDGNMIAIPPDFIKDSYQSPGFKVTEIKGKQE